MFTRWFLCFCAVLFLSGTVTSLWACESCAIPQLGRYSGVTVEDKSKKWFFKYLFEYQNWDEMDALAAHQLHHQGRHFHNKTVEEFHHFNLGRHLTETLTVSAEVPYITRHSLEIDSHAHLGDEENSEGLGDLTLSGEYALWQQEQSVFSALAGVKFPMGKSGDRNSRGVKFEPELQPGSGSFDYLAGGAYKHRFDRISLAANAVYVLKTQGGQDFEFGDVFSTSFLLDYLINPESKNFKVRAGMDTNFQYEQKQEDKGHTVKDSGGTTVLLGPALSLQTSESTALIGSVLFPVHQNLGGVHQELENAWTVGGKIVW